MDVCRGLRITPLRTHIWLSFSQVELGPRQEVFFFFFLSLKYGFRRLVLRASGTDICWRVSLKLELLFCNIAFPLSPVLVHWATTGKRLTNRLLQLSLRPTPLGCDLQENGSFESCYAEGGAEWIRQERP